MRKEGIARSVLIEKIPGRRYSLETDYTDLGKIQYILAQNQITIEDTSYTDKVVIHTLIPEEEKNRLIKELTEATGGRIKALEEEEVYFGLAEGKVQI